MNTAIKPITERLAKGEEVALAEASGLPSLPPMPADAFLAWLERADPGASLEYYRGFLIRDRSPETHLPEESRRALAKVANVALAAAERGRVHLVQRRNRAFDYSYLAIKAGRASASSCQSGHSTTTSHRPA